MAEGYIWFGYEIYCSLSFTSACRFPRLKGFRLSNQSITKPASVQYNRPGRQPLSGSILVTVSLRKTSQDLYLAFIVNPLD